MNGQDNYPFGQSYNFNNQPAQNYTPVGAPPQQAYPQYPQGYPQGYYPQAYPTAYPAQPQPQLRPAEQIKPQQAPTDTDILELKTITPSVQRIYKPMSVIAFILYSLLYSIPLLGFVPIIVNLVKSKNKQLKVMSLGYIVINLVLNALTALAILLTIQGKIVFNL